MEAVLGRQDLEEEIERLDDHDEILHIDLTGRDPDDGATRLPYEKGSLFLRSLEELFGRARFDEFLRGYFDHFAFQSITTADFVAYLKEHLLSRDGAKAAARSARDLDREARSARGRRPGRDRRPSKRPSGSPRSGPRERCRPPIFRSPAGRRSSVCSFSGSCLHPCRSRG